MRRALELYLFDHWLIQTCVNLNDRTGRNLRVFPQSQNPSVPRYWHGVSKHLYILLFYCSLCLYHVRNLPKTPKKNCLSMHMINILSTYHTKQNIKLPKHNGEVNVLNHLCFNYGFPQHSWTHKWGVHACFSLQSVKAIHMFGWRYDCFMLRSLWMRLSSPTKQVNSYITCFFPVNSPYPLVI